MTRATRASLGDEGFASLKIGSWGKVSSDAHQVALFAWVVGNVGASSQYSASHFAAHGAAGCVSAVAGGGKCGQGAASALVGKFTTGWTTGLGDEDISGHLVRGAAATISGGLASVAGGGEFKDGARTAAFGCAFNEMLTKPDGTQYKNSGRSYHGDRTMADFMAAAPSEMIKGNAEIGAGFTGVLGVGVSHQTSYARDTSGAGQCQVTNCFLVGPMVGSATHTGVALGLGGVPFNKQLSVGLVGSFVPGTGGRGNVSTSSGGIVFGAAKQHGALAGGAVAICTTSNSPRATPC